MSDPKLTKSEKKIYDLIVQGKSNQEISDKLCISQSTVSYHFQGIFKKTHCKTIRELIVKHYTAREFSLPVGQGNQIQSFGAK